MSSVTPHSREALLPPPVACVAEGGCSYLRALSTIERLAGFEQTASSYAVAASRCQRLGCWAAEADQGLHGRTPLGGEPVQLNAMRDMRNCSRSPIRTPVVTAIPFIRSSLVDSVCDPHGNYVERRLLKLETLPERGDPLGYLYEYWRGLRAETECRFANIDPVHLMRAGVIGKMHIVDVSTSDPGDFSFDLFGYAVPMGAPARPGTLPVPIYADVTIRDYNTVRLTGTPRLQRVRARLDGTAYHYTRLILPFLQTKGGVGRLLVAIRQEPGDGVKVEAS